MTKEEAKAAVTKYLEDHTSDHVTFAFKNYEFDAEVEQFEAKFDIDSAIETAYQIGRNKSIIGNVKDYISMLMNTIDITPTFVYNDDAMDDYIDFLEVSLPEQVEQPGYYVEDDELVITTGSTGVGIQKEDLKELLVASLQDVSYKEEVFVIPTYITYPDPLDVAPIHAEIYKPMVNASYTTNPYSFVVEETGVDFSMDEVLSTVRGVGTNEEYRFDLIYTKPDVKVTDFGMDAFPDLLGTYTTQYVNNANRTTNLRLAASKMNGTVIVPGGTFSFNGVVGPRTASRGYKAAAIYSDGTVVNDVGGGICQVVTTLYNAAIQADMDITERRNHSFMPTYVGPGYDATVVYGSQDFKFKNTRDYPIKIVASVEGGYCKVSIYGLRTNNEYDISIETDIIKTMPKKTTGGAKGYVVDSFRVVRQNGQVISREKIARDTYSAH
ncbi:MAG: VanW family protein [Clostridia bacterium]|nr:VanW family protein [Clostridia bacterium]